MALVLKYQSNIFETSCQTLVDPVNRVGVAGKGLALEFKQRFPEAHKIYVEACEAGGWLRTTKQGEPEHFTVFVPASMQGETQKKHILFFATKRHWREASLYGDIAAGLEELAFLIDCELYIEPIRSLALPALGCGLGGLDWYKMVPVFEQWLGSFTFPVELYAPLEIKAPGNVERVHS